MPDNATLKRHADLVDRMAQALGLDFEEEMMRGRLDTDGIGDAVLSCTGCTHAGACEEWLQKQAVPVAEPMEGCRNADLFARLTQGRCA